MTTSHIVERGLIDHIERRAAAKPRQKRLPRLSRTGAEGCEAIGADLRRIAVLARMARPGIVNRDISGAGEASVQHLPVLGAPDPIQIASEGALWGAIHQQGLLRNTVVVSGDAGQFRVGEHALCWIHAQSVSSTSWLRPTTSNATPSKSQGG
jgi:hypothetical protein